jgi:hypothetical protein
LVAAALMAATEPFLLDGYRPQSGSPAVDAGIAITDNGALDFWGTALTGTPDIGAGEFR